MRLPARATAYQALNLPSMTAAPTFLSSASSMVLYKGMTATEIKKLADAEVWSWPDDIIIGMCYFILLVTTCAYSCL